ncbi:MAG: hypothetical protein DK302_001871 [Chloroflexi bacterium]|nr:MAG: hypothetical protein DK302_001871 [Chloroflexota bacterium]
MGFFGNISNTILMMKASANVLKKDKELIFFPLLAAASIAVFLALMWSFGVIGLDNTEEEGRPIAVYVVIVFVSNFIIVFFNSALVSAALERLRGGDPNVYSGFSHALKHIHHILIWSIIVTIVAILIAAIKGNRRGIVGQILGSLLQAGWTMMTFFVVPIIVSENLSPFAAIKKSTSLFKSTWGSQITANFGFGIFQILALIVSAAIGWFFGLIDTTFGLVIGVLVAAASVTIIYTLEGIYKAALYEFALGEKPLEFQESQLKTAYSVYRA